MPAMTRCTVIRNPGSRRHLSDVKFEAALAVARDAGWDVRCVATERKGHATEIARAEAADGADVLIVHGGDGTLNEAINGVAGSQVAVGILPGGTANVWAKEAHIPRDPLAAMGAIVTGERRRIDLGRANGRYFLLMAGVGLDAEIVPRVGTRLKRWFGAMAYLALGVWTSLRTKPWDVTMRVDEAALEDRSLYWMVVGNTRSYGGLANITHRARVDDGLLDVGVMHRGGAFHLLVDGVRVLFKRHDRSPNIDYLRACVIEVDTPGLPVQIDGEPAGRTPMRFQVAPAALTVIVPVGLRSPLFATPAE